MNNKKIIAIVTATVLLIGGTTAFLLTKVLKSDDGNDSSSLTETVNNNTYDENNIGEVYCAPIDEAHVVQNDDGEIYIDNELLIVAKAGVTKERIIELAGKYNAEVVGFIEQTGDYQLRFSGNDISSALTDLSKEEAVSSVGMNYVSCFCTESVSYDIQPGSKWSSSLYDGVLSSVIKQNMSWGVRAVNAPLAWIMMNLLKDKIEPINVGLIDNEFDQTHEDLGFAEVFYENNENRVDVDEDVHGTHVAGTMAAKGNNREGICGVYPYADGKLYGASWRGADQYDKNNKSCMAEKCLLSELILRNVKVINCSYGMDNYAAVFNSASYQNAMNCNATILADFLNRLLNLNYDFVIVCSAGNDSTDFVINLAYDKSKDEYIINDKRIAYDPQGKPTTVYKDKNGSYYYIEKKNKYFISGITDETKQVFDVKNDYPGGHLDSLYNSNLTSVPNNEEYKNVYDRIIVVGAVDQSLNICDFSNAGTRTDIYAPGYRIFSTLKGTDYSNDFDGTSMAAPHVAGAAADVWCINRGLKGSDVKRIICEQYSDNSHKDNNGKVDYPMLDVLKAIKESYSC